MFRSCQIIIRELCCSLLKLYYNIQNLIRFCKQGFVALRSIRRTHNQLLSLQHIPTQHDMLPQHRCTLKLLQNPPPPTHVRYTRQYRALDTSCR